MFKMKKKKKNLKSLNLAGIFCNSKAQTRGAALCQATLLSIFIKKPFMIEFDFYWTI